MEKPFVVVSAPVGTRSGYGDHARDLVRSLILEKPDWDIHIISTRWGSTPMNALQQGEDEDIISRLWLQPQLPKQPDIWIQVTVPNEFQPIGKYNIGITAGIETTVCDPSWLQGCNRMDLIIVPSEHAKTVFEQSVFEQRDQNTQQSMGMLRLEKPCEVLFEGVDIDVWKKVKEIPKELNDTLRDIKESFCYLFVGHWLNGDLGQDRKDVGMLIKTFLDNFKDTKNAPALVLKTSSATFSVMDRKSIMDKIDAIRSTVKSDNLPNIYVLHGDLTPEEMNALYNHPKMKAMISFTKGEGYGRPLAEFARTGKPVLASNWSGHVDFLTPKHHIFLPGTLTPVHKSAQWKGVINEGTQWFTVDYPKAGAIMKEVHTNYKKYAEKSRGASHYMKENFSLEKMDKMFVEMVDKHVQSKPQQAQLKLPTLNKTDKGAPALKLPKLKKVTDK